MQPLMIPDIPPVLAYVSVAAFVFSLLLMALSQQEFRAWRRLVGALAIVLVLAGASLSAAQYVMHPCAACASASGLLWYALLCWLC
jgi:hypothetical protein